eukprot:TRINITY_DN4458_c0_g1_i3.p1 TRINITY_DN4458_c0_g1~~TRINITY_DN4458_c0_g1_i3.p1  ORF type:complete len:1010 (+),score=141.48 TRINITY_DN4458_c0_g1_i3:190-3030(+)
MDCLITIFKNSSRDVPRRSRVLACLNRWVDDYWEDFTQDFDVLHQYIKEWQADLQKKNDTQFLKFVETLAHKVTAKGQLLSEDALAGSTSISFGLENEKSASFADISAVDFAKQLTLYQQFLWQKISTYDVFMYRPSAEITPNSLCPPENPTPVEEFIHHFNTLSFWTISMVLSESDLKRRRAITKKLIDVCETLRELCNYNALMSIVSGLRSASVYRLKETWSSKLIDRPSWKASEDWMSPESNYRTYRSLLAASTGKPVIPFLGIHLTDMVHIEDGMPSRICENKVNFLKHVAMGKLIQSLFSHKENTYSYATKPKILKYVDNLQDFLIATDYDDFYQSSLSLEARKPKINPISIKPSLASLSGSPKSPRGETRIKSSRRVLVELQKDGLHEQTSRNSDSEVTSTSEHNDVMSQVDNIIASQTTRTMDALTALNGSFYATVQQLQTNYLKEMNEMRELVRTSLDTVAVKTNQIEEYKQEIEDLKAEIALLRAGNVKTSRKAITPDPEPDLNRGEMEALVTLPILRQRAVERLVSDDVSTSRGKTRREHVMGMLKRGKTSSDNSKKLATSKGSETSDMESLSEAWGKALDDLDEPFQGFDENYIGPSFAMTDEDNLTKNSLPEGTRSKSDRFSQKIDSIGFSVPLSPKEALSFSSTAEATVDFPLIPEACPSPICCAPLKTTYRSKTITGSPGRSPFSKRIMTVGPSENQMTSPSKSASPVSAPYLHNLAPFSKEKNSYFSEILTEDIHEGENEGELLELERELANLGLVGLAARIYGHLEGAGPSGSDDLTQAPIQLESIVHSHLLDHRRPFPNRQYTALELKKIMRASRGIVSLVNNEAMLLSRQYQDAGGDEADKNEKIEKNDGPENTNGEVKRRKVRMRETREEDEERTGRDDSRSNREKSRSKSQGRRKKDITKPDDNSALTRAHTREGLANVWNKKQEK